MNRDNANSEHQTILLLRWVLIIATSYLLLFHHATGEASPLAKIFLTGYLGSNLVAATLLRHSPRHEWLVTGIAAFDAAAVSLALVVAHDFTSDFFLLYFVVLLVAAQAERVGRVVAIAVVISLFHLHATSQALSTASLLSSGAPVRISFLFVVALFFGHLVERARSAERRADEALRNEKVITDSVEEIVRAFKIPLGAMHAISEILLESPTGSLTREHHELLRRMHANSRHVSRFAASLLDAGRVDADRLHLEPRRTDLTTIVEEALGVAGTASDLKGVSLELEATHPLPQVLVDVNQMDRAVWNLLDNAIRSAPAGGEVFVSLGHGDRDVVLTVSDDGNGIPPDDLPAIFDKLRHLNHGYSTSGFGLFVARAIIRAHGGTIEADSEVGGGTTLTVRLPITRLAAETTDEHHASS